MTSENCRCTSFRGVRRWLEAGLRRNAAYLVRPDGYVALADPEGSATAIASYLDARNLTSVKTPAPATRTVRGRE